MGSITAMKIKLSEIERVSKDRPEGYVEHVISEGEIVGDYLEISSDALAKLRAIYRPAQPVTTGLGDIVASVATPIARALHLPCIDPATQQLRPESGCAKRKAWLNGNTARRSI